MQTLDRDEVSLVVDARTEDVYALVADISRMAEFSPEVVSCRWLAGATEPAVGARFEAVNRAPNGRTWRNRPVVTHVDPGRALTWTRTEPFSGTISWSYRFEPVGSGTRVTEAYRVERPVSRVGWFVIERIFGARDRRSALRRGMVTTLERLRTVAEAEGTERRARGVRPAAHPGMP